MGIHKKLNKRVALKIYQKEKMKDMQRKKSVRREIKLMQRIDHPNIAKLYDAISTDTELLKYLPDKPTKMSKVSKEGSSTAWVHLHSTICTEWSQECMVIKHSGPATPQVKAPKTIHRCILKTSVKTKSQVRRMVMMICTDL